MQTHNTTIQLQDFANCNA